MYNLFSLYNVVCMYIFRATHLVLNYHLACYSLKKYISWALGIPFFVICKQMILSWPLAPK